MMDAQDRLWFGEYRGDRIGMFDTKTETFKEWDDADAVVVALRRRARQERRGVDRLDDDRPRDRASTPRPATWSSTCCRASTNIRRVFVDNSTTPVTFWVGSNHGASIIKLEPLD